MSNFAHKLAKLLVKQEKRMSTKEDLITKIDNILSQEDKEQARERVLQLIENAKNEQVVQNVHITND